MLLSLFLRGWGIYKVQAIGTRIFSTCWSSLVVCTIQMFYRSFQPWAKWSSVSVSIPSHHVDIGYTPKETKVFLFCHLILRQAKIRLGNMPMSVTLCCKYTLKIFAMASVSLAKWAGYLTQAAGGIVICYEIFRNMSGINYFSDWYFKPSFSNENIYVNIVDDVFRFLILEKKNKTHTMISW